MQKSELKASRFDKNFKIYIFKGTPHYNEIIYKFTILLLSNCADVS